jgi:hypothetical protein
VSAACGTRYPWSGASPSTRCSRGGEACQPADRRTGGVIVIDDVIVIAHVIVAVHVHVNAP